MDLSNLRESYNDYKLVETIADIRFAHNVEDDEISVTYSDRSALSVH